MNDTLHDQVSFGRILFCTDFSENADNAFPFALEMALRYGDSELHLLHVVPEAEAQFWKSYIYEVEDVDEKAKHAIDEHIDRVYRSTVPRNQQFVIEFRVGNAPQEILTYSKEHGIELIVMGRQGQSGFGTAWFGKVTEKISRQAECAVMIIPQIFLEKKKDT
jgi:nucleotide-binding universal stress UspA family protein